MGLEGGAGIVWWWLEKSPAGDTKKMENKEYIYNLYEV
jgi:hypothetical protein